MTDQQKCHARISGLTVKDCHLYTGTWKPKLGEKLLIACENVLNTTTTTTLETATAETNVIEVMRTDNGHTVGQAPRELWNHFIQFLAEGGHITAEITNTKFTSSSFGKEISCDYILQGPSNISTEKLLQELNHALEGPEFRRYTPSMVIGEETYCCYFHHAVSKAPDLEAKCKAMAKYPKRRRARAVPPTEDSDPRCSNYEETGLKRETRSTVVTDNVPKHLSRKKNEVTNTCATQTSENSSKKQTDDLLPDELDNDPWTRQIYESAIEQGQEIDFTMRLMVIGCYGQGKSSLAKRLMGQSIDDVESTNGIEVSVCEISNEGFKWEQKRKEDAATESIKRLVSIARSSSSESLKSLNSMEHDNDEDLNAGSDHKRETVSMDIDCNAVDLKMKRTEYKRTNTARSNQENVAVKDGKTEKHSSSSPKKKKIDSANVKRFSTELRKSVSFEKQCTEEVAKTLSIWDFGGQFVYYATHQLFHSRHAIYLLVFSLNESLDQVVQDDEKPKTVKPKTMKEYIRFWISSVHSFVGNEQGTEPSIILVGTKKDLVDPDVDIEQRFEEVRKLFDGSKMLFHIHFEHFAVSNLDASNDEIESLCKSINCLMNEQCKQNLIPARWIPLERKMKENRHLKIVNYETVLQFNQENEIPIEDEDQLKLFLQYHHARGTFFYFEDTVVSRIVLDPQFIVDAFKCLLTSERFCIVRPSLRDSWHKLCDKAILEKDLLHDVWDRDAQNKFSEFEDILIFFLQKHRIIAEALNFDGKDKNTKPDLSGFYIVPSLLSNPVDGAMDAFMKGKKYTQVSLMYIFEHEAIVPTLYYKITAAACGKWPVIEYESEPLIFENASVFKLSLDHAGMLKLHRNSLELLGIGMCPQHRVSVDENDLFRRFVEMVVSQELRKFRGSSCDMHEQRLYTMSIRCYHKHHMINGSKNFQDLEILKQSNKRRMGCPDNESHSLKVNKIYKEWYKADLDVHLIPKRTLTKIDLSTVSMAFEKNWQQLGVQLGFDKAEIEQIDMNVKLTTSMKIFEMLNRWVNREIGNATLDVLIRAINKCKKVLKIDKDVLRNLIDEFDH